ncbi:hypothetical protein DFH09DRAFT_1150546 [Mycena vulgaris]|nr:hypothetical protein DFH09DRAFT_1150546 [Mycena vulgaris]
MRPLPSLWPWVLVVSLSFTSLAVAQTQSSSISSTISPPEASFSSSSFDISTASATASAGDASTLSVVTISANAFASPSAAIPVSNSSSMPFSSASVSKGPIVAAAVGGSIASCLVVLAGTLFCFRHRTRRSPSLEADALAAASESRSSRRCDQLEGQLRALQEQIARLEARVDGGGGGGGVVLYTNEKDAEVLDKNADAERRKEALPVYVD